MKRADLNNLLRILKLVGGKFVIVEDGVPQAVLMDYKDFEELTAPGIARELVNRFSAIDNVNMQVTKAQLQDLRDEVIQPEIDDLAENFETSTDDEITVEPISPF